MANCGIIVDDFLREDGTLDVSEKYLQLMRDSVHEDSLYMRAKDTIFVNFDNSNLTAEEKAKIVSEHVATMTTNLSAAAMQTSLSWAKEERDGAYALAKLKADTEVALAQAEKVKEEICLVEAQVALQCAQITATTAGSIRDNGTVASYDTDGCKVLTLEDEGLKYEQTQQIVADRYSRFADAYRKSGVVQIGVDIQDGVQKGLSGDEAGLTNQQEVNAERLRISYEDTKRNHAANSSASMIASMLSSEIAPKEADVQRWRDSVDWLNTSHSTTSTP